MTNAQPDTVTVAGVQRTVIARETAEWDQGNGNVVPAGHVDKLLLDDGSIIFRCTNPNPVAGSTPCLPYVHNNVRSVMAHQRSHSVKALGKKAQAELAKVAAEQQAEFTRRSRGMRAANDAKRARHAAEVTATDPQVRLVQRNLSDLGAQLDKITEQLTSVRDSLRTTGTALTDLIIARQAPELDVEKLTTEQKFDLMKKLMS